MSDEAFDRLGDVRFWKRCLRSRPHLSVEPSRLQGDAIVPALDRGQGLGRGLFARESIDRGDFISFYGTSKHRTPGFEMEHGQTVLWGDPAGVRPGQLAQLANYAPHSSCNALFVKVDRSLHRPDGSYTIALIAWTQIQSGDEICAYYGYDPSAGNV